MRQPFGRNCPQIGRAAAVLALVSGALAAGSSVAVDRTVNIPDPNLRTAIEAALGKEANARITVTEMASLTSLMASSRDIVNLTGLEHATGLTNLALKENRITDVSPLAGLTSLTTLWLGGHGTNRIVDLAPLAGLTKLTGLGLYANRVADLSPLAGLTSLRRLLLGFNRIADVTPLAGLTKLRLLQIEGNQIVDVTPLAGLTSLKELSLSWNQISDVTPLAGLISLETLSLEENRIADVTPLAGLTQLTYLRLNENAIEDLAPLAGLRNLTELRLMYNQIADVVPLANLTSLRGILIDGNQIADAKPFSHLTSLTELGLSYNEIGDATPLASLNRLDYLRLGYNRIADVAPLAHLTSLTALFLDGNQIADVTPLASLTSLNWLYLRSNRIVQVSRLGRLASLTVLELGDNRITDATGLAGLTSLSRLGLGDNRIVNVKPLAGLTSLTWLALWNNRIEDIAPLVYNPGIGADDVVHVWRNPLSGRSRDSHIRTLGYRGARVVHRGHDVPFFPAGAARHQGLVRTVSRTSEHGWVWIHATDDVGESRSATRFESRWPRMSLHFDSDGLERGKRESNTVDAEREGLRGVGPGEGSWRLELYSDLDVGVSAYVRTSDGFLTAMNALAPETEDGYRVPTFNPGSDTSHVSTLRLANPGYQAVHVVIRGVDDRGRESAGSVQVALAAGEVRSLTAQDLESGSGLDGALGNGAGKWRLYIATDQPIQAMSLLESPKGHLTNLSSAPNEAVALADGRTRHRIPLFPAANDPNGWVGLARVVNRGAESASIQITAFNDAGRRRGPVTLTLPAGVTRHLDSVEMERGEPAKGLPSGIGRGKGDWRLALTTRADIEVLSFIRHRDGFITAMHDTVAGSTDDDGMHVYEVPLFNPGSDLEQVSRLRAINVGRGTATLAITGIAENGATMPKEAPIRLKLRTRRARTLTAQQLATGEGVDGALGDAPGRWRLLVRANRPILLMNLMANPTGHLTNLSGVSPRQE